jgi:putative SOS response-associated peptidase YedK
MCGRYVSPDAASITGEFSLVRPDWRFPANFNTAPSQVVPAIRSRAGQYLGVLQRWGFGTNPAFNAAIETLATSAVFRASWNQGRRCIIPAMGFYQWHVNSDGSKQPYYIHVDDQDVFGFAGLWEQSESDANAVTESCSIITMPANELVSEIHGAAARMPAILTKGQRELWLFAEPEAAAAALCAYAGQRMIAYQVSDRVNSPHSNDEGLLEPLETDVD